MTTKNNSKSAGKPARNHAPAVKRAPSKKTNPAQSGAAKNAGKIAVLEGIARYMLDQAASLGATDCELSIQTSESVDTSVRHGVVEQLEGAQERGVFFKAFVGQKSASAKSSDFRRPALRKLIQSTIALATASEADPFAGLVDKKHLAKKVADLGLYDPAIAAMSIDRKIELAIETEAFALAADARITNSSGASFSDGGGVYLYANSRGFVGAYPSNYCSLSVQVVATDPADPGAAMQTNGWHSASRTLAGLETPSHIGAKASSRAIRQLGARKVKSQVVPVVFDPQMAARLLAQFVGATKGTSIDRKTSFLLDKLGEAVAAAGVNIVDDPTMPGKLGSKPFDGDGIALKRRYIVKAGKLETYLVDGYAARKLKCEPNSDATGNLYIEAGDKSPEEIIASVKQGLYLTSVSGPGFNAVTGDYSLGASGIWIEDGKLSFPVAGITVASNLLEMFAGISAIGNDLEFRSGTSSPTLLIDKMTVGGE